MVLGTQRTSIFETKSVEADENMDKLRKRLQYGAIFLFTVSLFYLAMALWAFGRTATIKKWLACESLSMEDRLFIVQEYFDDYLFDVELVKYEKTQSVSSGGESYALEFEAPVSYRDTYGGPGQPGWGKLSAPKNTDDAAKTSFSSYHPFTPQNQKDAQRLSGIESQMKWKIENYEASIYYLQISIVLVVSGLIILTNARRMHSED